MPFGWGCRAVTRRAASWAASGQSAACDPWESFD